MKEEHKWEEKESDNPQIIANCLKRINYFVQLFKFLCLLCHRLQKRPEGAQTFSLFSLSSLSWKRFLGFKNNSSKFQFSGVEESGLWCLFCTHQALISRGFFGFFSLSDNLCANSSNSLDSECHLHFNGFNSLPP